MSVNVTEPARDSRQREAVRRFRRADSAPPPPQPAPIPRDRGECIGKVDRDDGAAVRVVWQPFPDGTLGPAVGLRLWRCVDGEWWPEPGRGLQLRTHEVPLVLAALNVALARARRWAELEEAGAERGRDGDRDHAD